MKNILLIDSDLQLTSQFLSLKDIKIKLLVTFYKEKAKAYLDQIDEIYHQDLTKEKIFNTLEIKYNLSYEEIETYRSTQLKVESYYHRFFADKGYIQNIYYKALSFWLDYFKNNKINLIFSNLIEHGGEWDSIIFDIAKKNNIPVYILSLSCNFKNHQIYQILYLNNNTFLKIESNCTEDTEIKLKKIFSHQPPLTDKGQKNNYFYKTKIRPLPRLLQRILFGIYAEFKIIKTKEPTYTNKVDIFKNSSYVKNLKKVYNKLSSKANYKDNYIYYPLHLEPEASIMNRTTLSSQLFIIELISTLLPKGWKLYVKEHPHQFSIYRESLSFLNNISYFRGLRFYEHISNISNVIMIDIEENSTKLIQHSKAIAAISSTSLIEAVYNNKPILNFGVNTSFVELLKDCFNIRSKNDLQQAIAEIYNNFSPSYKDLKFILNNYIFIQQNNYKNIEGIIHSVLEYKPNHS
ncbi:hypothetical protein I9T54_05980 [Campylobacter peloridis]|uniref:capsular polysaccharide export protein, LipB/KpsS family n=1 Tax=Campylobacter peloridis TaxID=488546 RepID=UPI001C7358B0|nr:hypothetical protein [Campylobacter peloridis]MBX2079073.1 hypothetical protein [Campylobacter peloridis]